MARVPDRSPAPSRGTFRFVGRERELDLLLGAVRRPPAVVLVEGEAGIGKSRLIAEATGALTRAGTPVLTGFCHPLREPLPYGPVVDALGRAGPWLPAAGLPLAAGALAPLLPDLADRLPPPPVPTEDPRAERLRMIQAVRSFLNAIDAAVLIVEDLHWADEATRELLLLLARDLPERLSLILTYRTDSGTADSPVLGSAYRHPPGTGGSVIPLRPLTEPDLRDLAADSLGAHATPALAAALYSRSEGLPLVAEEDLLTLTEHSRAHGFAGITGTLREADVPRGLREAMTERLAALSPDGVAVTAAAAVLAVPATQDLLADVAGLDRQQAEHGLVEALQGSVLREAEGGRYAFRHALAQQVAYGHVLGPRRARLHRHAVAALQQQSPPPLVQIAHHTLALGDRAAWLQRAEEAADQAVAVGDTGTAAALFDQMLDEPDLDTEIRSRAARTLAQLAARGVDPAAQATRLRRILADPHLPGPVRGEIRLDLGLLLYNGLADSASTDELERAIEELGESAEQAARALSAVALSERQEREAAWAWQERAERVVAESSDEGLKAMVYTNRLSLAASTGDPAVWALLDALPRRSDNPNVLRQTVRALFNAADAAADIGQDRHAAPLLKESQALARRIGYPIAECYIAMDLLRLDMLAGRWDRLEERLAEAVAAYPAVNLPRIERALLLGRLSTARGRRTQALQHFTAATEHGERHWVNPELRAAAGLITVHLAQDAPALAWATATEALELLRLTGTWPKAFGLVPAAVEAALACGEQDAAERIVEDAARGLAGRDAPAAVAELQVTSGLLAMTAEPVGAAEHFAVAQDKWRHIGRPYETAGAAEHRARALAAIRPAEAAEALEEAAAGYASLGASADLARVETFSQQLGLAKPRSVGRHGYGTQLSPRERQVAEQLANGATNQEIADALFLSPRTVEHHVANVLKKLDTARKHVGTKLAQEGTAG